MVVTEAKPTGGRHATREEVERAIRELGEADLARLGGVARLRTRGLLELDWEDVLHEAFARSIDGARRWPLDIPFVVFVRETIRSITSEAWRIQLREARRRSGAPVEVAAAGVASPEPDAERIALDRAAVAEILGIFADDPVAVGILEGIGDGEEPAEIQARLVIGRVEYDSARRRIRRRVATWMGTDR